jgi:hypothetical protein
MDISVICGILDCNRSNVMAERSHNLNSQSLRYLNFFSSLERNKKVQLKITLLQVKVFENFLTSLQVRKYLNRT